jgi:benzylsuccinate CoA-transferase BbsF subunit
VATALAAGLLYRRRTGHGVYLDVSQVECANYSLAPWLLDYERNGEIRLREGNRHASAVPHGAFPCGDESGIDDRWVAIACWTDDQWDSLARAMEIEDPSLATFAARAARIDEVETLVADWTRTRRRLDIAEQLQAAGVEAVPVEDFGDLHDDPQLANRNHFEPHHHEFLGDGLYERNGFRLRESPSGYDRAGPTLGQDTDWVLRDVLGLDTTEIEGLRASGAVE